MKLPRPLRALAAVAAAALMSLPAQAIDVDAGDYTALPPGTNLFLLYGQHATRDKLYADGDRVGINPKLDSTVGILRGVHFMDIGGYIVDPQFLLPFGKLDAGRDISALGSNTGVADLILAATVWFNKADSKTHFGITPFLFVPIGQYDNNEPLNLGENRWKFALQAGYITPVTDKLTLDLVGDFTIHGKNNDFGPGSDELKQKVLFQFQGFLRYHLSPATDLRLGLSHVTGGETEVNGVDQDNRLSTSKFNIGASHFIGPKTQLLATYGRDLSVRNGFKEDGRFNFRILQIF
jgi:hypothetical protein